MKSAPIAVPSAPLHLLVAARTYILHVFHLQFFSFCSLLLTFFTSSSHSYTVLGQLHHIASCLHEVSVCFLLSVTPLLLSSFFDDLFHPSLLFFVTFVLLLHHLKLRHWSVDEKCAYSLPSVPLHLLVAARTYILHVVHFQFFSL